MSTRVRQALQGAAGAAGGEALNVEDVFSIYPYEGTGTGTRTINNGIDLSGSGGLVWTKARDLNLGHVLYDSERSGKLSTNESTSEGSDSFSFSMSNSGYSFNTGSSAFNQTGNDYVSWTFRKAPKFFDVVTYTGTGSARTVSHNLGSVPGCIFIKCTSLSSTNWLVYHRGAGNNKFAYLNSGNAFISNGSIWQSTTPTDTQFYLGTGDALNGSGQTYVAYLFAHNNSDGEFGPDGDQDIIKCGYHYGSWTYRHIHNLGIRPQFLAIRPIEANHGWRIYDSVRGLGFADLATITPYDNKLEPHSSNAESGSGEDISFVNNGIRTESTIDALNSGAYTYIYIAIGTPTKIPESSNECFDAQKVGAISPTTGPWYKHQYNWTPNMGINRGVTNSSNNFEVAMQDNNGWVLETNTWDKLRNTNIQDQFSYSNGYGYDFGPSSLRTNSIVYFWKKAPHFFDNFVFEGNGSTQQVEHRLGVVPEMMWLKNNQQNYKWWIYHKDLGNTKYLDLTVNNVQTNTGVWNSTTPTSTHISVGSSQANISQDPTSVMLFATLSGISKVGSYTGNGTSNTVIDCGFSNGAKFVLIKNTTDYGYGWYVYDTARGISYQLQLDSSDETNTQTSAISSHSSGFTLSSSGFVNTSGKNYIFYAIATP